jgi:hypothetical protein
LPAGSLGHRLDAAAAVAVPAVLAAGVVEGVLLGWGQARVLTTVVPALRRRQWIAATVAGAVLAYVMGLAPSTFATVWQSWATATSTPVAVAVLLGAALLGSIGFTQWLVLRRHVARAGWWVPATAAAWLAGLTLFLAFATPLWHPGQALVMVIVIGVAGGLLMAVAMAAVTGAALCVLVLRPAAGRRRTPGGWVGAGLRHAPPGRNRDRHGRRAQGDGGDEVDTPVGGPEGPSALVGGDARRPIVGWWRR